MNVERPGYWAIIPADVRYDDALPPNAKLLYGEISALCDRFGYCYAHNRYFAKLYGWSVATVQRLLSALSAQGYVRVDVLRDKRTHAVIERRIYAGLQAGVTPPLKNEGRSPQNQGDPPLKNDFPIKEEQYKENLPPLPPKGGRRDKSVPKHNPEAFEKFWTYYRKHVRGEDRVSAVREWDRLKPDDDLIRTMGEALMHQVATNEDWKRGYAKPYACRWIKNRRWEDDLSQSRSQDGGEEGVVYEDRKLL